MSLQTYTTEGLRTIQLTTGMGATDGGFAERLLNRALRRSSS